MENEEIDMVRYKKANAKLVWISAELPRNVYLAVKGFAIDNNYTLKEAVEVILIQFSNKIEV